MGILTLSDFRTEICDGLQRGSPDKVGVPRVNRWIHNAMYEFAYALKFRELEAYQEQSVAAGINDVVFPDDFRMMHENGIEILGVENFEGALRPETRAQFIQRNRTVGAFMVSSRPKYYHIFGNIFKVRPTPDVAYTLGLHYWKRLAPLADNDVSVFDEDWDDVILTGALYRGFRHFNEFDRYQNVKNDFVGLVRSRRFEEDIEEFPEGGIHPVTWRDTEDPSFYGEHERDTFGDPTP